MQTSGHSMCRLAYVTVQHFIPDQKPTLTSNVLFQNPIDHTADEIKTQYMYLQISQIYTLEHTCTCL